MAGPDGTTADPAPRVTAPAARRRGPASTEEGQRSRDRVLQAALDLIIEVGIDRVRLAEVARRAGMSSGQVMYYFASKEHILLETLAWQEHQDLLRRRATLADLTGAWRKLEEFIGLYLPADPADPSWILWLEAWARAPHNREVSKFLDELINLWRDDLTEIIARGIEAGEFTAPANLDDFTYRYIAVLDGLALQGLRQMHQVTRERLVEFAVQAARLELAAAVLKRPAPRGPASRRTGTRPGRWSRNNKAARGGGLAPGRVCCPRR